MCFNASWPAPGKTRPDKSAPFNDFFMVEFL
jgi:hypothetical protein